MKITLLGCLALLFMAVGMPAGAEVCPGGRHAISGQKLDLLLANHRDWHVSKFTVGKPASFRCLDLRGQVFDELLLLGADFSGADLTGASMMGTLLMEAKAIGTDFSGARLSQFALIDSDARGARFDGADLSHAALGGSRYDDAHFRGANLKGAIILDARLWRADLSDSDLSGSTLARSDFRDANLAGADLTAADADETKFVGANLSGVTLRSASLFSTDFTGARFSNVDVTSAFWEASAPPDSKHLDGLSGLASLRYDCFLEHGLRGLREALWVAGHRVAAHEVTYAIESARAQRRTHGCIMRKSGDTPILYRE